jgi:hypothetical protein
MKFSILQLALHTNVVISKLRNWNNFAARIDIFFPECQLSER